MPDHAASLESQSQMSLVQSNWEPISKRYLQQAEAATDPALASSLYLSVAEFQLKYGGEPGAAEGERFLRKSLELDPRNRRSSQHLERLLRDAGKQDELLDLYGRRAEQARSKEDRAVAELAAGELSDKLGRPDQALVHYKKALESNPVEHRALRAVIASLSAQQSWTELSKILDTAARSKRGEQDVPLLVELGNLLWKQLGQVKEAEATFRRVRKIDPGNHAMVDFYREYFTGRNEIPQLVSLLAQAQKMEGDVARQVAMGIEMARAVEQREGRGEGKGEKNAEKAIDIWKGLLRLQPHLPEAVESLKRLYTRTEKWNALLELLKEDLETVADRGRRRKGQSSPGHRRDLSRSLEPGRHGGQHLLEHRRAQARPPAGAGGAGGALRGAGAVDRPHPDPHAAGRGGDRDGAAAGAAPARGGAVGREAGQAPERGREPGEDPRDRSVGPGDLRAAQGAVHPQPVVEGAARGLQERVPARPAREAARPPGRDGARWRRSVSTRRARRSTCGTRRWRSPSAIPRRWPAWRACTSASGAGRR